MIILFWFFKIDEILLTKSEVFMINKKYCISNFLINDNQMVIHKSIKFQFSINFNNFSKSVNANTK
jgi:hypothetical protein